MVFVLVEPSDAEDHPRVFGKSECAPRSFAEVFPARVLGKIDADTGNPFRARRVQGMGCVPGVLAVDGDENVGPPRAQLFRKLEKHAPHRSALIKSESVRGIYHFCAALPALSCGETRKDPADRRMAVDDVEMLACKNTL